MPYIHLDGKNIYYVLKKSNSVHDKSRAIIFIHGSGGSYSTWKNQIERLNVNFHLIALSLPSHTASDKFDDLSLELYVNVVEKMIEDLELQEVILCGHSLGGAVIQSYYFKYPNKVVGLILVGTGARLRVSSLILESLSNNYDNYLDNMPSVAFYRKTPSEIIEKCVEQTSKVPSEVTYNDFKICDGFDTLDKTEKIDVPSLIICGKQDKLTPMKYSTYFKEKIKTSELVIIDGAGHHVMLEKPVEFNNAIEKFIDKYFI